jgi:hypothetical protein
MPGEAEEPRAVAGRGSRPRATRRGSIALVDVDVDERPWSGAVVTIAAPTD